MMPTNTITSPEDQQRQIETQLTDLEARLRREYADTDDRVGDVLAGLRHRFADARIKTFLPILIERAARMELQHTR